MQMSNRRVRARAESLSHAERIESLALDREDVRRPGALRRSRRLLSLARRRSRRRCATCASCPGEASASSSPGPARFTPFDARTGERYLAHVPNRTAYARLYAKGGARPAVIAIHGYMGGHWAIEERAWPIRSLNRWGLDVALAVLPFHGVRARPGSGAPPFPGGDPRVTNEGFRQVVADLRSLAGILRARGATSVGVMGMSLGGYSTALFATLEADLAFAVPLIPLASVADFAREQGRLGHGRERRSSSTRRSKRPTASSARSPVRASCPQSACSSRRPTGDRVTPIAHAERLAAHFGVRCCACTAGTSCRRGERRPSAR